MKGAKNHHLKQEEMICAVVDMDDLEEPLKAHLRHCEACKREKEQFENQLERLGHAADHFTPSYRQRVVLPDLKKRRRFYLPKWQGQHFLAAAGTVVLIIVIFWWNAPVSITPYNEINHLKMEMLQDEQLLAEVQRLAENPLPQIYFDISGEDAPFISKEFIEFIVPETNG